MFRKAYLFSILQLVILILSLITDWYLFLSIAHITILLIIILDKLGKGIVLREMIAFHSCFVCLAMPLVGYAFYTRANYAARIWVRYMPVQENIYFDFVLPALSAFIFTLCFPIIKKENSDEGLSLQERSFQIKTILTQPAIRNKGVQLIAIGILAFLVAGFLPAAVQFITLLFYFAAFAGILYVYFSPRFSYKPVILIVFILFVIINSLNSGMFTVLAYMGITMFSIVFLGKKMVFWKKTVWFIVGAFTLLLIQSIKPAYRSYALGVGTTGAVTDNKAEIFVDLLSEKLTSGDFFSGETFFMIYYRTNQGFNIGLVMRRVPRIQPHDGGTNLFRSTLASVVPRFLWPDKPEAGGKFNMKYYAGVTLRGWSTNIGPLGEAYGGFGVTGGIVYMFVLGAVIRWVYRKVFVIANRLPLLICWLPVLFYQVTYSAETDTLQILNSLLKGAFFIWLLYKITPSWFGRPKNAQTISVAPQVTAAHG